MPNLLNLTHKLGGLLVALSLTAFSTLAHADKDPIYTSFLSNAGVGGYDVVAYFTEGKPVKGNSDYSTEYKGADWRFSSQANLDAFNSDPERYIPQYGGYCAWAVAQGYTASGDPTQWAVVNDKLYLNYNANIQSRWEADRDNFITMGDQNWPGVLN